MTLTLTETNALLTKAGIEPIESSILQKMLASFKPALVMSALKGASKDVGAKRWVLNNLEPLLAQTTQNQTPHAEYHESDVDRSPRHVPDQPPASYTENVPPANYQEDVAPDNYQERQAHHEPEPQPRQSREPQQSRQQPRPTTLDESREYRGHHVYGTAAALYFACSETKAGVSTLSIDGATSSGKRTFDWSKKVSLQVTQAELPIVAAVLFGYIKSCEFKSHGPAKNKGFKIEVQSNTHEKYLFFNLMEAKKPMVSVPVSAEDAFYIRNLLVEQLLHNSPQLDSYSIIENLKVFARMKQQPNNQ